MRVLVLFVRKHPEVSYLRVCEHRMCGKSQWVHCFLPEFAEKSRTVRLTLCWTGRNLELSCSKDQRYRTYNQMPFCTFKKLEFCHVLNFVAANKANSLVQCASAHRAFKNLAKSHLLCVTAFRVMLAFATNRPSEA